MFLKKLWKESNLNQILLPFLIWKLLLFGALLFAISFIPLAGKNFYGGGLQNYLNNPYLFAWANFDGEHYLSIAQIGYKGLEQAFFPVYPGLIHALSIPWDNSFISATVAGLLISNVSFLIAMIILYKLLNLDYSEKFSRLVLIVILTFPMAFYFGSLYNESLFLLLSVGSFYFARKKKWYLAGIFGMIASATRVFGFLLLPALLLEIWQSKNRTAQMFWLLLIPLGFISYMGHQWLTVGDPLAFYHLQETVGPQHDSGITLLPQIYFRYIKILLTTPLNNPIYPVIVLELIVGLMFFLLPIIGYLKKVRLSYLFFALFGFLLPTVQGSFSSVPRYIIIFFPSFLILALLIEHLPKYLKLSYFIFSGLLLIFFSVMFLRGYWVA